VSRAGPALPAELEEAYRRDREVWESCARSYEEQIVHGHPEVQAYLGFEEDLLDRLLLYLVRDCRREVQLHDVGCGSGRLHLRYGRQLAPGPAARVDTSLAAGLKVVSGLDFSRQMLDLARRKLAAAGLGDLVGSRLLLEEGSAFDMAPLPERSLPVAVALCNTIGVMQGPAGAGQLFAAMRRAVEAGGIAMVSCYRREAVESHALGNYESTMDVSGQPRWLEPSAYASAEYVQVPRGYRRAFDRDPSITVDVRDRGGKLVAEGHVLTRDPEAVREVVRTGHVRTYSDYESRWYAFEQIDAWIAEHWAGAATWHLAGGTLDALRASPVQLALVDFSGLLAGFIERCRAPG
jgi:SAM-dependent methyltransferase